jgi:outer membrane protein TolC
VQPISLILLACLTALAGCSAGFYSHWADRQVQSIVSPREESTLGYTPQVDASSHVPARPATQAYAKVPPTPKPPPATSPIEPSRAHLPYGPLGPQMLFPPGVSAPQDSTYGLESAMSSASERLKLGPPAPTNPPTQLDLFGSVRYAVENGRDYKSRMEDLYLAALDVTLQRHLFEPRPFARTGLHYSGGQEDSGYAAALTAANTVGVRQKLPYGGEVVAQATADFVRAISGNATNGESAALALSASIPLLRGAGLVNLEPLIQSERSMVYEIRNFEQFRRNFIVDIASRYFRLLAAQQSIADRSANLTSLQSLTARSQALYAAGRVNYIDVQRALQSQLQAEQDLINAQVSYRRSLDDFKLAIGMPTDQRLEVVAQELSVQVPRYSEADAAELAVRYRLDLRTAADQVEDAQRNVQVAKNGLLPDLDLTASGQVGNRADDPASHINNDTSTYSANIDLELPLDRVAERNTYRSSLIRLERSSRSYDELRDQIAADARDSLRLIRSAEISLDIQSKGIELAKLRLENANELLRQGKRDNRDVVDAQNDLLRAQEAYEVARASLQIQVLQFLRDTGTLRVDPAAGAIGQALDRRSVAEQNVNEPQAPR